MWDKGFYVVRKKKKGVETHFGGAKGLREKNAGWSKARKGRRKTRGQCVRGRQKYACGRRQKKEELEQDTLESPGGGGGIIASHKLRAPPLVRRWRGKLSCGTIGLTVEKGSET